MPLPNTAHQSGPLLSSREEAARFALAAERFLERTRQDPRVAEQFLRAIGYYEIMDAQQAAETPAAHPTSNGSTADDSTTGDSITDDPTPAASPPSVATQRKRAPRKRD